MPNTLQEIRFLLLGVWTAGLAWVIVQAFTNAAPPWVCVLLATCALLLGQVAIGLNAAETEYASSWKIENRTQRIMYWLLALVFFAFSAKTFAIAPNNSLSRSLPDIELASGKSAATESSTKWSCVSSSKDKTSGELTCMPETTPLKPNADYDIPDPWDKMDKYASVFGFGLTSVGLLMAVLTGWVIVIASDFRRQLKELQAAANVDEKLLAAARAADFSSVMTSLHVLLLDCETGTPDQILLIFALRSLHKAEEGKAVTANLLDIARQINHAADAMRNGAPHAGQYTRQACREYMPIVLMQLIKESLQGGAHLRGEEGVVYREALKRLLNTVKGL